LTSSTKRRRAEGHPLRLPAAALLLAVLPGAGRACDDVLFTIERSLNANVVVYEGVLEPAGGFFPRKPVDVYWLLKAEHGERDGLNLIERGVYGYNMDPPGVDGEVTIRLKARRSLPIRLRTVDGCPRAFVPIDGREARLDRVWVQVAGRGFLSRKVEYLELLGTDPETDRPVSERIVP